MKTERRHGRADSRREGIDSFFGRIRQRAIISLPVLQANSSKFGRVHEVIVAARTRLGIIYLL